MFVKRHRLSITTDASGDATVRSSERLNGEILQILYTPDGTNPLATGADFTITGNETALPILTKSNVGTTAVAFAPRQATHAVADGAALLYAAAGAAVCNRIALADEQLKLVVAQGGNVKSGTLDVWVG